MKIAFLVSRFPYPIEKGDKLRAFYQIKGLAEEGHEIILCSLTDKKITDESKKQLSSYCQEIHIFELKRFSIYLKVAMTYVFSRKSLQVSYFHNKRIQKQINKVIHETKPEHIFCQLIRTSEYVRNQPILKTLDYMDVLSRGMQRQIKNAPFYFKSFIKVEAKRLMRYEHQIFNYFDNKIIISKQDKELIVNIRKDEIAVIPNGIDFDNFNFDETIEKKYDLLFAGNMAYPPNIEATSFLIEKIMPLIWQKKPDTKLMIAGANPAKEITKHKETPNIFISGWVEDLSRIYNQSIIFVAPLFIGTGLQNKLLEAMAMHLPCITTAQAFNAIDTKNESAIIVAKEPDDFAKNILKLLSSDEKRKEISEKNYKFVKEKYTWEAANNKLNEVILAKG